MQGRRPAGWPPRSRAAPLRPGELELHFICTGCGENMFYRLPDGTTILNEVGERYRPKELAFTPLLPSADRLGGDWVSRYIRRVYQEKDIDYLIFSHWHDDHIGHVGFDFCTLNCGGVWQSERIFGIISQIFLNKGTST